MSLAKAVVTGTVFRTPEKRFTQNNIAIYGFTLNIAEQEETLIRVISKRKALETVLDNVKQGDKLLVEGRLQIATSKYTDGTDKKYYEIDASAIELVNSAASAGTETGMASQVSEPVSVEEDDEEIPF